ncbi:EAL domain-containing protein, partial [Salmonella enterica subsp. enterica]
LVRWDHPTRGTLGAGEFVPLAEENGTILAIDRWVLETACTQLAGWTAAGLVDDDFVLRVNISVRHLEQRDLVDRVRAQLEHSG